MLKSLLSKSFSQSIASTKSLPKYIIRTKTVDSHAIIINEFKFRCELAKSGGGSMAESMIRSPSIDENKVYVNSDLFLSNLKCYGFDYDYTLVHYKDSMLNLIYDLCVQYLVDHLGYPHSLATSLKFDPNFAIRGLHFDQAKGILFKLDQYSKIQAGTVYCGKRQVSYEEVVQIYGSRHLPSQYVKGSLASMSDRFSSAESSLLADITEFFTSNSLDLHPTLIYADVQRALYHVHTSGLLHNRIILNPSEYLIDDPIENEKLYTYLSTLKQKKKVFLLTNSKFEFVDAGLSYIFRRQLKDKENFKSWKDLFNPIICNAQKPNFFSRERHFRKYSHNNSHKNTLSLSPVDNFQQGEVYSEGCMNELNKILSVDGQQVLYMGDQVYSDLLIPHKAAIWKTGCVVNELSKEIELLNTTKFKTKLGILMDVENLIEEGQTYEALASDVTALKKLRDELRQSLKVLFNPHFGSMFRTWSHRTMLFYNIGRFSDIYTSSITNLLNYPLHHVFYTPRQNLPHEHPIPQSRSHQYKLIESLSNLDDAN